MIISIIRSSQGGKSGRYVKNTVCSVMKGKTKIFVGLHMLDALRRYFFRLFQPIFDMSLFWKIGVVIGTCVLINTSIAFYFFCEFNILKNYIVEAPFYAYKSLAQEGLLLLEKAEHRPPEDPVRAFTAKTIKELALIGLRGGVYESSSQGLIEIVTPTQDTRLKGYLEALRKDFSVSDARQNLKAILKWSQVKEMLFRKTMERISSRTEVLNIVLYLIVLLFLVWGATAFYFMVKRPLDKVTARIDRIFLEESHGGDDLEGCGLTYYANDEIGRLTEKVKNLLADFNALSQFKHTIEEDQTASEVYERLGRVLREEIGIPSFALYEVSNSQNAMRIAMLVPAELEVNPEKLLNANLCRAKRTGHVISSLYNPGVCPVFLWQEEGQHYCVPLMSGGQCIGVAQLILPRGEENRRMKKIYKKIRKAEKYLREATPAIEAKRYAESLKEQTLKDPLTGLYNRRFLEEALDNIVAGILRRKTIMGIIMADIDYFKSVNDQYGHDTGDKVLKETAQILKDNVRASDLVVRFGGEEFLIILVDVQEGETPRIADKLRKLVEEHQVETPKGTVHKTISMGVSEFPVDCNGPWEAIKYADVALYKAKEGGRNRVVRFTSEMWTSEEY